MKVKLLSTNFIHSQFSFSQTIKGKVVIIMQSLKSKSLMQYKNSCSLDANGEFSIIAKTNDILVFVSKEHQIKNNN
jgi:hypothetical protein